MANVTTQSCGVLCRHQSNTLGTSTPPAVSSISGFKLPALRSDRCMDHGNAYSFDNTTFSCGVASSTIAPSQATRDLRAIAFLYDGIVRRYNYHCMVCRCSNGNLKHSGLQPQPYVQDCFDNHVRRHGLIKFLYEAKAPQRQRHGVPCALAVHTFARAFSTLHHA